MKKKLIIISSLLTISVFMYFSSGKPTDLTHGFTGNYVLSKILLQEENLSNSYDTTYFYSKTIEYGIHNVKDIPNIPTSSFLFVPLALFKPEIAKAIWTFLNIIFYILSIFIILRIFELELRNINSLVLLFTSLLFFPVYYNIKLAQIYIFLLFLFSLSLYGLKKRNVLLTALPISLMMLFRGYGLIPLIFLLAFKNWRELITSMAISAGLIIISLPLVGLDSWKQYFIQVPLEMGHNEYASYSSYQVVNSFIRHIIPGQSELIYTLIVFILLAMVLIVFLKRNPQDSYSKLLVYSSAISLNVIFAPVAEEYHFVLFLPLIFGIGKVTIDNYKNLSAAPIILILSLFLLFAPLDYKTLNQVSFPLILLAYPRLYGGILLILFSLLLGKKGVFNELSLSTETEVAKSPAAV